MYVSLINVYFIPPFIDMNISRRDLLLSAGAFAFGSVLVPSFAFAKDKKNVPLCLQLYSVGGISNDPAKRFAELAKMGYQGVEYAGFGGKSAKDLRKFQDDAGLICTGSHTGRGQIENLDELKKTIEFHLELGAKFIICPGMGNNGVDGWKKAAESFSKAAEVAAQSGLYVGYHAHQHDFNKIDGDLSSWEVFADNSCDKVQLQIDLGHCVNKGADPYALIAKYPGRTKTIHLKESDNKIIGEGRVDWKKAFELCETVGGVETYTVEYEGSMNRMEAVEKDAQGFFKVHG